jgi:hypothetical protein
MIMTSEQLSHVSSVCCRVTGEYKRVLKWIGLEGQLKVYSLGMVRQEGTVEILDWCHKIEKILGFKPGAVNYVFQKGIGSGGKADYWKQIVYLGYVSNVEVIVHELAHLLSFKDVTVFGQSSFYEKRKNNSYHNEAFAEWLVMAMDNVLEHADELGIRVYSAEDVWMECRFF